MNFLAEALNQTIVIQQNGKPRQVSVKKALALRLVGAGLKGDLKTIDYLTAIDSEIVQKSDNRFFKEEDLAKMSAEELSDLYFKTLNET